MTPINLIPAARRLAKERRLRVRLWVFFASVYACLAIVGFGASHVAFALDDRTATNQLEAAEAELSKSNEESKSLRLSYQREFARWETQRLVAEQPDWSLLLGLLAKCAGEEVVFQGCQIQPVEPAPTVSPGIVQPMQEQASPPPAPPGEAGFEILISGLGRTQSAISGFVLRLEQLALFDSVRLVETRREPFLEAEVIAFRVECSLGQSNEGGK